MLMELSLDPLLDQEFEGRHRAEHMHNSEVSYIQYLIGWIVKTYDYFLYIVSTLPQSACVGT